MVKGWKKQMDQFPFTLSSYQHSVWQDVEASAGYTEPMWWWKASKVQKFGLINFLPSYAVALGQLVVGVHWQIVCCFCQGPPYLSSYPQLPHKNLDEFNWKHKKLTKFFSSIYSLMVAWVHWQIVCCFCQGPPSHHVQAFEMKKKKQKKWRDIHLFIVNLSDAGGKTRPLIFCNFLCSSLIELNVLIICCNFLFVFCFVFHHLFIFKLSDAGGATRPLIICNFHPKFLGWKYEIKWK